MKALEKFRIDGKVAIVTGGTKGLGREIAGALANGGARVVVSSRTPADVDQVAKEIAEEFGTEAAGFAGDVGKDGVAEALVKTAVQRFGRLDIVVNNAGINIRGAIDQVTPDEYDQVMSTNVKGPWLLCRAAASTFKAQKSGRVINIASTLGLVGMADRSLYCSSKGAIVQFTRELAVEWAPLGITVNALCPGPFETEMNKILTSDPQKYQQFANLTAMRRWGRMGELGPVVLFLASEAASYVTGAILPVDGGWVAF
ncbi:MAG: SDR family NAD(P)-dependent oxidoreductase [Planctomycetota bacterium]